MVTLVQCHSFLHPLGQKCVPDGVWNWRCLTFFWFWSLLPSIDEESNQCIVTCSPFEIHQVSVKTRLHVCVCVCELVNITRRSVMHRLAWGNYSLGSLSGKSLVKHWYKHFQATLSYISFSISEVVSAWRQLVLFFWNSLLVPFLENPLLELRRVERWNWTVTRPLNDGRFGCNTNLYALFFAQVTQNCLTNAWSTAFYVGWLSSLAEKWTCRSISWHPWWRSSKTQWNSYHQVERVPATWTKNNQSAFLSSLSLWTRPKPILVLEETENYIFKLRI